MSQWRNYQGRIFSGLVIIAIGVIFLLVNMDRLDFGDFVSTYWPMILILIGISHLLTSGFRNAGVALFMIAIGSFFQLNNWGVLGGRVWAYFWPLLIIAAGLWNIFKPRPKGFGENAPEIKQDDMGAFVILSDSKRRFSPEKMTKAPISSCLIFGAFSPNPLGLGLKMIHRPAAIISKGQK